MSFAIASLLCVGFGFFITQSQGVALTLSIRNVIAWLFGLLLAILIYKYQNPRFYWIYIVFAVIGLMFSLQGSSQQGVHRWIKIGPVVFNVAQLFLPAAIVAFGAVRFEKWQYFILALCMGMILSGQPDASQCFAFSVAIIVVIIGSSIPKFTKILIVMVLLWLTINALFSTDNLPSIPEVEGIIKTSFEISSLLGALSLFLLVVTAIVPLGMGREIKSVVLSQWALCAYFITVALAPLLGAYPVPLMGIGFSSIIGSWLGIGLLCNHISSAKKIDQSTANA